MEEVLQRRGLSVVKIFRRRRYLGEEDKIQNKRLEDTRYSKRCSSVEDQVAVGVGETMAARTLLRSILLLLLSSLSSSCYVTEGGKFVAGDKT